MHIPPADSLDRRHRPNAEIEVLRAIAIIFVIIKHGPLICMPYPAGGLERLQDWINPETGVDLFFVISGYLIGRSFVGPYEASEYRGVPHRVQRVGSFWVRRFYRLVPAATLWCVLPLIASLISGNVALWLTPREMFFKAISGIVSLRNFEESYHRSFFGYYWSLSVENQFYVVLPLMLLVVARRWRIRGLVALCALNAVWRPGGDVWWLFRYDGLVYGLLLFEFERSGLGAIMALCLPRKLPGCVVMMVGAWTVLLTFPLILIDFHPLAWAVANCAAFLLVFAASQQQGLIPTPLGLGRPMLWIGARSYSLYLCHIPIWFVVIDVMRHTGLGSENFVPLRFMIAALATLTAAELTYRWLELPLQERGRIRARALDNRSGGHATQGQLIAGLRDPG
ncbi:MAG: acyltransferase family protein [Janthinobacterium lividum]